MITLIIPTIGTTDINYFEEALTSALNSSTKVCSKIIFVDNSQNVEFSTFLNNHPSIQKDPRCSILSTKERLSMAANWNFPLNSVDTQWLLYLHDDDILNLEVFNKIKLESLSDVAFHTFNFVIMEQGLKKYFHRREGIRGIVDNTPKFVSTLINTGNLKSIGGWDEKASFALDFLGFLKLHQLNTSETHHEALGFYRIHASNASSREKRIETYGNALPYVLEKSYNLYTDNEIRRQILFTLASYSFPNQGRSARLLSFFIRKLFKMKAWFYKAY